MAEELQDVKLEVGLLKNEVEAKHDTTVRDELKILHTRIGDLHDKQLDAQNRVEQRLDRLDQYKSKLMGMIVVVGGALGITVALLTHFL